MVEKPTAQINVGRATALLSSARAAIQHACHEIDDRIENQTVPTEADYLRQMSVISMSVEQLAEAMQLLERTQGGNDFAKVAASNAGIEIFALCLCTSMSIKIV